MHHKIKNSKQQTESVQHEVPLPLTPLAACAGTLPSFNKVRTELSLHLSFQLILLQVADDGTNKWVFESRKVCNYFFLNHSMHFLLNF